MLKSKTLIPIVLIVFCAIGLISYFTTSHIHTIRKLNESVKHIPEVYEDSIPFIDLNDKKVVEEQMRKIKRYKSILGETVKHLPNKIFEDEEETKLRSLAESFNEFEDVKIVDPNTEKIGSIQKWFVRSMKQYTSNIVLYPYYF